MSPRGRRLVNRVRPRPRRWRGFINGLLALATLPAAPATPALAAQDLAVTGATILNPADESTRHGVLLIEDGKGPRAEDDRPRRPHPLGRAAKRHGRCGPFP